MADSNGVRPTASALDSLLSQSTGGMHSSPACCCGRPKCAYLEHNDAALRGLEQDLQSAAQIGQALLARHEAYIAEAEGERRTMNATVSKLEDEKKELEDSNAKTIEENRYLLDQLEASNHASADADSQITSLNATLQSTMQELDRLTALAAQTSQLEKQLESLEAEQYELQQHMVSKEDSEKSAIQRWKNAERTINLLQEQLERIEREAKEERARHAEVVSRFEQRRLVEKELENAAGRLKGAAAARGMSNEDANHSVISSFVKDILQDNATLQLGIVELRDMLLGSNEEVENLREQMMLHQPVLPDIDEDMSVQTPKPSFLDDEFARTPTAEGLPDFHVHHHYHAAPKDETKKTPALRRPKKRRHITSPSLRTPSSGAQTPRTPNLNPMSIATTSSAAAAAILAQTSVTIPPTYQASHIHNWSMSQAPSSTALSSVPNSPIFDALSDVPDSSRPTTPGSTNFGSPQFLPRHTKRGSDVSDLNLSLGQTVPHSLSSILHSEPQDEFNETYFPLLDHNTIPEEPEDDSTASRPSTKDTEDCNPTRMTRPVLHRASSHESLLSSRGLDIPKMRSKPSTQLLSNRRTTLGTSISSGVAITSATAATAHRSKAPRGFDSKSSYNNLLSASSTSASPPSTSNKNSLGNRVGSLGGWIAGRWGVTPASSADKVISPTSSTFSRTSAESKGSKNIPSQRSSTVTTTTTTTPAITTQPPSQKRPENRLSTHIEPVQLDNTLLQETLHEETGPAPTLKSTSTSIPTIQTENPIRASSKTSKPESRKKTPVATAEKERGDAKRLSTHVEALSVDGAELAEALGEL